MRAAWLLRLFLGFFLILGLGVVLVAMRGGPRGVRDTLEVGRKRPLHAAEFAVAGAIAVFGLAVPAVVLLGDQASAGPGGTTLSADAEGRPRAVRREVRDLPHAQGRRRRRQGRAGPRRAAPPAAPLTINAIEEGRAGKGQMPAQLLEEDEAKKVAEYIAEVAGR